LLARNAAWPGRRFALITGFMEAGETPEEGIAREIAEETNLHSQRGELGRRLRLPAHEPGHHRLPCGGTMARLRLSPELAEYKLYNYKDIICWPAGTGYAVGGLAATRKV
jgi:8-oxo-dGTP pyrophosphatase MutT (NUDIX family)